MNWINPREKLPEVGQLIWCLIINNRQGERSGDPSAEMVIGEATVDRYGVTYVLEITPKGYPSYSKHFFEWWHYDQSEKEPGGEVIYRGFSGSDIMITAWLPYDGLPEWDYICIEESKNIIMATQEYKKGVEYDRTKLIIEKARIAPYFIRFDETKPSFNGLYVVANNNGVWLSKYKKETCDPWIAPNGERVLAWYPVPESY